MFAAAMLDALPDLRGAVLHEVASVLPAGHAPPALEPGRSAGLAVKRFRVPPHEAKAPVGYPDLARLIDQGGAAPATRRIASDLLRMLGEAEARVHGCPLEQVHFHEIADWDTLADLSAAAAILSALETASWSMTPLPLGGGTVHTRHGVMAVPAPATATLLEGLSVHDDGIGGERVTPTGACIARYIATRIGLTPRRAGRLSATGHGAGSRDLPDRPNILVAQVIEDSEAGADVVTVLEFDIDDMTGEETAAACDALRTTGGVIDVTGHPVQAKKGRTATRLRLLARPDRADEVAAACFRLTSTIGLRLHEERRLLLPRAAARAEGLRLKTVLRPGGQRTAKAESDDLASAGSLAERRLRARQAEDGA